MKQEMLKKIIKNALIILVVFIAIAGLLMIIARTFDVSSVVHLFERFITVQISIVALIGFAMINFLFIINLLYTANIQNKKEREIDRAKNEFIALVSHQLRTPLSAVNWYTESLATEDLGPLNSEQKEYVAKVHESNHRMISLVNSILEVSRIELNTFMLDAQKTNIALLVKQVVDELAHAITEKNITLKQTIGPDLESVMVDPRYIQMIIDNLLSNAVKYTPESGTVTLEAIRENSNLMITVSDTGYGIPDDQKDKVFTKLFRAKNILSKDTDGTGLGLYIVKSIVNYAGGTISFTSEENRGTSFKVSIPLGSTTTC